MSSRWETVGGVRRLIRDESTEAPKTAAQGTGCSGAHWFAYYGWPGTSSPTCVRYGCSAPNPKYDPKRDMTPEQRGAPAPAEPSSVPDQIVQYLAGRDMERRKTVTLMWSRLTDRERRLVKDAAIMGFVQGNLLRPATRSMYPKDSEIVMRVLDAARAHSDLYPGLAGLEYEDLQLPTDDEDDDG